MKRYIALCILFSFYLTAYAQNPKTLRKYYDAVNKAELAIIDNNLPEAKKLYEKAFGTGNYFPIDTYNAFRVSYVMKDTLRSVSYFNTLAKLGQEKENFIRYFLHSDSIPKDPYMAYVTKDYEAIHNTVMKSNIPLLAQESDSIDQMDNDCRNREMSQEEFMKCNIAVLNKLYHYVDTYGFPGHYKTGLMEGMVGQGPNPGNFDLMIWHARSMTSQRIYSIGFENVQKGLYDAEKFARAYVFEGAEYQVTIPRDSITRKKLNKLNKKRAEIFLEPLEDLDKKIQFMMKRKFNEQQYFFVDPFFYGFAGMSEPLKIKG